MGYKVPKLLRLKYEEGEYAGAEIACRMNVRMEMLFEISRIGESLASEDGAAVDDLSRRFAGEVLAEWNLEEEDGTPTPATEAEFMALPLPLRISVIQNWAGKVADVPAPLGARLPATSTGVPSAPASMPMVTL